MYLTDPIGDMLTRIRNAIHARHETVDVPASVLKTEIARILKEEGFIYRYEVISKRNRKLVRIVLKYGPNKTSMIRGIRRISSPGRRIYVDHNSIPLVFRGFGIAILTTPKGVVTDSEARRLKVGGEVLCHVW